MIRNLETLPKEFFQTDLNRGLIDKSLLHALLLKQKDISPACSRPVGKHHWRRDTKDKTFVTPEICDTSKSEVNGTPNCSFSQSSHHRSCVMSLAVPPFHVRLGKLANKDWNASIRKRRQGQGGPRTIDGHACQAHHAGAMTATIVCIFPLKW